MARPETGRTKKICPVCQKEFELPNYLLRLKTCSRECGYALMKGRAFGTPFKKGQVPWNKGNDAKVTHTCRHCSKEFQAWAYQKLKYCSTKCGGLARRGAKAYQWKKDRTEIDVNKRRHWSTAYREWRTAIFERDGYECKISSEECGSYIEAHHILGWKDYPELRFTINNGITLCRSHHPRKREEEKRLVPEFQALVSVSKDLVFRSNISQPSCRS